MPRPTFAVKLFDLALISVGFAAAVAAYRALFPLNYAFLTPDEVAGGLIVSAVTFWVVVRLQDGSGPEEPLLLFFFDRFCRGTGVNLLIQAALTYFQLLTRSMFLIVAGGLFATFLLALARRWVHPHPRISRSGVLIIGFDPIAYRLACMVDEPILGVIGAEHPTLPFLGDANQLEDVVSARRPALILVASADWAPRIAPSLLLKYRLSGIALSDLRGLYEKRLQRVYCQRLEPVDLLLSPAFRPDSRTMAIQAIYTNLIGLFFLLALSPAMAVATIAVALFSGPGSAIEGIECAGFQDIPFRLLRFRTLRRDGSGQPTRVGGVISRMHLANLPRLINIVRGEIALFGPRPVRREFARRLTEIMPAYSLRFSVKPGILGWAQVNLRREAALENEFLQLEYDLYYIKEGSPSLDLEILIRTLLPARGTVPRPAEYVRAER